MTPDERDTRVLDGLLKSFGEMSVAVARQDERIAAHQGQLKAMRADHRDETAEIKAAVYETGVACKKRIDLLETDQEKAIEKIRSEIKAAADKAEVKRERNEWTLGQKIALASASFSPMVAAIALVVK